MQPAVVNGIQKFVPWQTGVWAYVSPLRGTEMATALAPPNLEAYEVRIRYRPGVRAKMRLVYTVAGETQTLEISGVNDVDSRHIELQLTCAQAVN